MQPEHTKLEKLSTIIIGLSLLGYLILKPGSLKATCDVLLIVSILAYMISKTVRYWTYLAASTKKYWVIQILAYVVGSILQAGLHSKIGGIIAEISIVAFSITFQTFYKKSGGHEPPVKLKD